MKNILLFGAGKSATVLIQYLLSEAEFNNWMITVADANLDLILEKTKSHPKSKAVLSDINDEQKRSELISSADIVISMMPPALHILIAKDCIQFSKSLLTASYIDDGLKSMDAEIKEKGLIFLCEMGLDPGIDHMSAMELIHSIIEKGGEITSFKSHCGGLVAPESDDNPWHYKISWNPRNVVLAGKAGAIYLEEGAIIEKKYQDLFKNAETVSFSDNKNSYKFGYYPNRNSLPYIDLYQLKNVQTFVRTTLRYPEFMDGWNNIIELNLTDETPSYHSDEKTLMNFFKDYFQKQNFNEWLDKKLSVPFAESAKILEEIKSVDADHLKMEKTDLLTEKMEVANLILKQLYFLGMDDNKTFINKGFCSPADVLQFALEKKLALQKNDKDMVVMLHEIEYKLNNEIHTVKSSLVVKGEDALNTAMAKTVGLPLGIAAKLILNGEIKLTGLHIPITKEIYTPILKELKNQHIEFYEVHDGE